MDTAALVTPMLFFRAGRYDVSSGDLQGTASRGDYWSAVANTSIAYYSDFHNSRLAPSASFSVLWAGFSVRCISFSILLSGSYGLAEGNSTNAGTAVLAIGFILSGNHQWDRTWETSRSRNGYYQTRTVKSNNSRYVLYISTTIGIGNTNFGAGMV